MLILILCIMFAMLLYNLNNKNIITRQSLHSYHLPDSCTFVLLGLYLSPSKTSLTLSKCYFKNIFLRKMKQNNKTQTTDKYLPHKILILTNSEK